MTDFIANLLGEWSQEVNLGSTAFKIALSVLFATILGLDRARNRHAAGLRTFIVVSLASTSVAIADLFLIRNYGGNFALLSAATVIGIAIISTNTILFSSKNQLKGLTTSAGLWASCIIAVVLGLGLYTAALIAYIVLLLSITLFTGLEKYMKDRSSHFDIHLELKGRNLIGEFTATIRQFGLKIDDIEINPAYANSGLGVYSLFMTVTDKELKKKTHGEIISLLSELDCVSYIEEL